MYTRHYADTNLCHILNFLAILKLSYCCDKTPWPEQLAKEDIYLGLTILEFIAIMIVHIDIYQQVGRHGGGTMTKNSHLKIQQ